MGHTRAPTMDRSWRFQETPRASDVSVKGNDQKSKPGSWESQPSSLPADRLQNEGKMHMQLAQKSSAQQPNQDLQAIATSSSSSQQQQQQQQSQSSSSSLLHGEPIVLSSSPDYPSSHEPASERSREKSFESTAAHTPQDVFLPPLTEGDEEHRSSHSNTSRDSAPRSSSTKGDDETRSSNDHEPSAAPFPLRDSAETNKSEVDLIPGVALPTE